MLVVSFLLIAFESVLAPERSGRVVVPESKASTKGASVGNCWFCGTTGVVSESVYDGEGNTGVNYV